MNLQYIKDSNGQTTGVFIPIKEWNELKERFEGIEETEIQIPEWQKQIVRERIEVYQRTREHKEFNDSIDEIEREL